MPKWAWAVIIVGAVAVAAILVSFRSFSIPGASMAPTLIEGDWLFVSVLAYGAPERGDVAVFKHPGTGEDFVKRVVGLPGETVQLRRGVVHIDGQPVGRQQLDDYREIDRSGRERTIARYRETLPGGRQYAVLEKEGDTGLYDDTGTFSVPAGQYFMLGDNRDDSMDSRGTIGFVPLENFVGRAELIWMSEHLDRLFTVIQ